MRPSAAGSAEDAEYEENKLLRFLPKCHAKTNGRLQFCR